MVVRDCDVIVPNIAMHHFSTMKEPIRGSKGTYLAGKSYIVSSHKMSSNYYHLLVDVIPSLEHAVQEGSYDHIVFHPSKLMDQALDMMGVSIEKREPFLTEAAPIVMDEAVCIDCTGDWDAFNAVTELAMGEVDTEGEFKFYPSYESVLSVRRAFIPAGHLPAEERTLVIFTHRPPPTSRAVENAELLIGIYLSWPCLGCLTLVLCPYLSLSSQPTTFFFPSVTLLSFTDRVRSPLHCPSCTNTLKTP